MGFELLMHIDIYLDYIYQAIYLKNSSDQSQMRNLNHLINLNIYPTDNR